MTAIAIWRNDERSNSPVIWVAADTCVSSRERKIIEDGAKIMSIPVVCREQGEDGFFSKVYHATSLGYCFAGSTLMGQNSYLGLVPLLSNLISVHSYVPSISDIASQVLSYLRKAFDEYKVIACEGAMFEAAIYGICPVSGKASVYHFKPVKHAGVYQMDCESHSCLKNFEFVYLGDYKNKLEAHIQEGFNTETIPGRPMERSPKRVIQEFIDDDDFPTIGGDVQLGIATKIGFQPYMLCKPRVKGKPEAYFTYLGREASQDILTVGEARVAMPGMV